MISAYWVCFRMYIIPSNAFYLSYRSIGVLQRTQGLSAPNPPPCVPFSPLFTATLPPPPSRYDFPLKHTQFEVPVGRKRRTHVCLDLSVSFRLQQTFISPLPMSLVPFRNTMFDD